MVTVRLVELVDGELLELEAGGGIVGGDGEDGTVCGDVGNGECRVGGSGGGGRGGRDGVDVGHGEFGGDGGDARVGGVGVDCRGGGD